MQPVYVMVLGTLLCLSLGGTFDASYEALRRDGLSAAATAFVSSVRDVLRSQDQSRTTRERILYRDGERIRPLS